MTDDAFLLLSNRLCREHHLPTREADLLADHVWACGGDVRALAVVWARTGHFPDTPRVAGVGPAYVYALTGDAPGTLMLLTLLLRDAPAGRARLSQYAAHFC